MTDIEYVAPVEGAVPVDFDHGAAAHAIAVLRSAGDMVGDHAHHTGVVRDATVVHWTGRHRHEFERAHGLLARAGTMALDALHDARGSVLRAVRAANEEQAARNRRQLERSAVAAGLPLPPGD
jgi:hypothetical protein